MSGLAWSPPVSDDPTPEQELEASIFAAMTKHRVTCDDVLPFLDSIMLAVRAYAAGDSEALTAERRAVLHRERADIGGNRWVTS